MEIKITFKDGERSGSFKFTGDPLEVVQSGWGRFQKFVEDSAEKFSEGDHGNG